MSKTTIEWSHDSANAGTGCSEARFADGTMDPLCVNCYARLGSARMPGLMRGSGFVEAATPRKEKIARLYDGVAQRAGRGARWTGVFRWDRELLDDVFADLRPWKRTFLGSMTDMMHPGHDPAFRAHLAACVRRADRPTSAKVPHRAKGLIILTKRADLLLDWQREHFPAGLPSWVWPGVSMGTQQGVDERAHILLRVKADVRVVSAEPLLGDLDFSALRCGDEYDAEGAPLYNALAGASWWYSGDHGIGGGPRIGWVIAGCESGTNRRPTNPDWLRSLRDQCSAARVPYFLKQMDVGGEVVGTPVLDGRTWTEVPR